MWEKIAVGSRHMGHKMTSNPAVAVVVAAEELVDEEKSSVNHYSCTDSGCCRRNVVLQKSMYGKAFIKFADVWQYADTVSNVPVQVIPTQVLVNADGTPFVPSEDLARRFSSQCMSTAIPVNTYSPSIRAVLQKNR